MIVCDEIEYCANHLLFWNTYIVPIPLIVPYGPSTGFAQNKMLVFKIWLKEGEREGKTFEEAMRASGVFAVLRDSYWPRDE